RIGDAVHQHDRIGLVGENLLERRVLILAHQGRNPLMAGGRSRQSLQAGIIGKFDAASAGPDEIDLSREAPLVAGFHVEHSNRAGRRGDQLADWLDAIDYFAIVAAGAPSLALARIRTPIIAGRGRRHGGFGIGRGQMPARRSRRGAVETWFAALVAKVSHRGRYYQSVAQVAVPVRAKKIESQVSIARRDV